MPKNGVENVVIVSLVLILVFGLAAMCNRWTSYGSNAYCTNAGYDGYIKADGDGYCYRIMDGTRVLTPYSVVPKVDK